jgi:hypothetical protein
LGIINKLHNLLYPKLTHKNAEKILIFVMDVVVCSFDVATAHSPSLSQVWQITTWSFNGLSAGPRGGAEAKGWAFLPQFPREV